MVETRHLCDIRNIRIIDMEKSESFRICPIVVTKMGMELTLHRSTPPFVGDQG